MPLAGAPSIVGVKILSGNLTFGLAKMSIKVPVLSGWNFADSLLEV